MTVFDHIRSHLLSGVVTELQERVSLEHVLQTQTIVSEFERLRRNRLAEGYYRYRQNLQCYEPGNYRPIESAIARLQKYLIDGNQEWLLDAANLCAVEFVRPGSHDSPHMDSVDDGEHASCV